MEKIIFLVFSVIVLVFLFLNSTFAGEKAYIANRNAGNVSVIDIDSAQVVKTITVGFQPTSVAASEDGSRVFILNVGDKTISVINPSSDTVVKTLDISFTWPEDSTFGPVDFVPGEIVASPSGDVVYVAGMNSGILVVNVASGSLTEIHSTLELELAVSSMIDISPTGDFFYVGTWPGVFKFDATTLKLVGVFDILPSGIIVTEDGKTLYATTIFPLLSVVDTKSFITDEFDLDGAWFQKWLTSDFPNPATVSPNGKIIYFISDKATGSINIDGPSVASVDMINKKLLAAIAVGTNPSGIDITSDGKKLVIPNTGDNTVSIIDAETLQVLSTVAVGPTPRASKRFIVKVSESGSESGGEPKPDIKVNGLDSSETVNTGSNLSITIELDPGDKVGGDADWWVYATSPFGTYWFTLNAGWQPSNTPIRVYGGPLFYLSSYPVLSMSTLPVGNYTFNFEVDGNMDNVKDGTYTDAVDVEIQ